MNIQININENYKVRTQTFNGKETVIVPVTMMVEGVRSGSKGAILNLISELGKIPAAWNGIPVVVNHPKVDGHFVSANSPDILQEAIGTVFNTKVDGDKLKAEAWIDKAKLMTHKDLLALIEKNMPIEVSIGSFSDDEEKTGTWNGEDYIAVAYNYRPDHLAILPHNTGACSFRDGCGIRNNQKNKEDIKMESYELTVNQLTYKGTETTPWKAPTLADFGESGKWSALTRTKRNEIAAHYLIGTGVLPAFGMLHFPVVNPKTGKLNENALRAVIGGRGSQLKAPANVINAARKKAYQLLNKEFNAKLKVPTTLEGQLELLTSLNNLLDGMSTNNVNYYLIELYSDFIIFAKNERQNDNNTVRTLYSQKFTLDKNDIPTLEGVPVEVIKKVNYINVNTMTKEEEGKKKVADPVKPVVNDKPKTVADYLNDAPAEIKEQVNESLRVFKAEKDRMIETIVANTEKDLWKPEDLAAMCHENLRKLFKTVDKEKDYSVLGANITVTDNSIIPLPFPGIVVEPKKEDK